MGSPNKSFLVVCKICALQASNTDTRYSAWTCYADKVSIWAPLASQVVFGIGILSCFISSYQYIIDAYTVTAASGLAVLTVVCPKTLAVVNVTDSCPAGSLPDKWSCGPFRRPHV